MHKINPEEIKPEQMHIGARGGIEGPRKFMMTELSTQL